MDLSRARQTVKDFVANSREAVSVDSVIALYERTLRDQESQHIVTIVEAKQLIDTIVARLGQTEARIPNVGWCAYHDAMIDGVNSDLELLKRTIDSLRNTK